MDEKLNKMFEKMTTRMGGVGWGRGTIKASKKNSTWLWLIKIFYIFFFFFKEDLKTSEKLANCLKILHGKFRQFASIIRMFTKENKETSPHKTAHGRSSQFYLILGGNPEVCAAVTNKVLLSGREGTVEFPLVGEQPSFSFSRYSACTGL